MGNFEIFFQTSRIIITLFALGCLFFASLVATREKKLLSPLSFLMTAFIFEFLGCWQESVLIASFSRGETIENYMMAELSLFLLFMIFTSLAASAFITKLTFFSTLPVWILGSVGIGSIVLFTIVIPDGDLLNDMRLIFPLAALVYLSVGLVSRFSTPYRSGYVFCFIITFVLILINISRFFDQEIPWYTTPMSYILFAFSFMQMKSNILQQKLGVKEQEIFKYHQKIEEIIKLSPFPIIISRLGDDKIILANNNAIKLFGLNPEKVEEYHLKDFFADSDNRRLLIERLESQKEVQDFEVLIKTPISESPFWLLASVNVIDYNYDVALYSAFQDITSRKNREAILKNQAIRDPLTSLYNRRFFEEDVGKKIIEAKKQKHPYSVLMLDADLFKKVNDTYGHKVGDKVLIELANISEKALRDKDVIARYGGEEFVAFLSETTSDQAYKVAERLRQSIEEIIVYSDEGQEVRFTVSIGVSSSDISSNVDMLIKTADEALYKAKQNGRNRVEIFTKEDWQEFIIKGEQRNKEEKSNLHPIYDKENSAEISLLDGIDTKDIQAPLNEEQ